MSQRDFWSLYRAQRRHLLALEQRVAQELHLLWQAVPQHLRPTVDRLLSDYAAEVARVREATGNPHATVEQYWLWQRLVTMQREVNAVVHTFATHAARTVTSAHAE